MDLTLKKEKRMKLILSPIDTMSKIELDIETYMCGVECLFVVFKNGRVRQYPFRHLWYWETEVPSGENRSKPPKENL